MTDITITSEWLDDLLALAKVEEQVAHTRAAGLLDEAGLSALLDKTATLMRRDPGYARQLARLAETLAGLANAAKIVPRATYLRAQAHAVSGDFERARELIESARSGYEQLGLWQEALRTNIGLTIVLTDSGNFQNALTVGFSLLNQIDGSSPNLDETDSVSLEMVRALVYASQGRTYCEMGQYDESLAALSRAEAIYRRLNKPEHVASAINNRGITLRYLGRINEALEAYQQAAAVLPESGYHHAIALHNIGDAQLLLGDYSHALKTLEEARNKLAALDAVEQHFCALDMADAYLTLNLYPEALAAYQEAEMALRKTDQIYKRGLALWGMGSTFIKLFDLAQAETYLAQAQDIFQSIDNVPLQAAVLVEQAALQAELGDLDEPLLLTKRAIELVSGERVRQPSWPVQAVYAHMRMADLLVPDWDAVEAHLLEAERFARPLSLPQLRYRLDQRWGHLRLNRGQLPEAQRLLEASISEIERMRNTLTHEAMRTSFLHDKVAAYTDLVQLHLERAEIAGDESSRQREIREEEEIHQAFNVIERAKSRALAELIAGAIDSRIDTAPDSVAAARFRELQAELNAIYDELLRNSEGEEVESTGTGDASRRIPTLLSRTSTLEREISRLRLQIGGQMDAVNLFAQPLTLREIQAQVPSDLILLTYYVLDDEIMAFVTTGGQSRLIRHVGCASTVHGLLQQLSRQREPFRGDNIFVDRHMDRLERAAQQVLTSLYMELVSPTVPTITAAIAATGTAPIKLAIVPHGLLHQVPFHALYDGKSYLIERFEISYAPSATVFTLSQRRSMANTGAALLVGVADAGIPAVEAEVSAVAPEIENVQVLLNEQATYAALGNLITQIRVLHLACHGLFRTDNPMFSALKLHDRWLTALDLAQFNLTGTLVVLSACESGRGQVMGGDEVIGLARACLGAGASSLIVSHWLVQDDATAILMVEFYAQLSRGVMPAAALRAAQLVLKSSHPHPYYWAPFVLMGSREALVTEDSGEEPI